MRDHNLTSLKALADGANVFGYSPAHAQAIGQKIDRLATLMRQEAGTPAFYDNFVSNIKRYQYDWLNYDWVAVIKLRHVSVRDPIEYIAGGFDMFRDENGIIYCNGKDFFPIWEDGNLNLMKLVYVPGVHESLSYQEVMNRDDYEVINIQDISVHYEGDRRTRHRDITLFYQDTSLNKWVGTAKCYYNPVAYHHVMHNAVGTKR